MRLGERKTCTSCKRSHRPFRERDRQTDRQTETEKETGRERVVHQYCITSSVTSQAVLVMLVVATESPVSRPVSGIIITQCCYRGCSGVVVTDCCCCCCWWWWWWLWWWCCCCCCCCLLSGHRDLNCQEGVGFHCNRCLHQYGPEPRGYVTGTS